LNKPPEMKNPTNLGRDVGSESNKPNHYKGNSSMSTLPQAVVIDNLSIRQDEDGRYCLNDLHKAAGGEEKHSPNRFTRTETFNSLVNELTPEMAFAPYVSNRGGLFAGTYVCKELVYAYAMWISAAFHVKVLRTFDKVATGQIVQKPVTMLEWIEQTRLIEIQRLELAHKVEELQPKANALDTLSNATGTVTLDQAAKLLGVQPKKFLNPWLVEHGWCFRRSGDLNPHQDKVDKKLLIAIFRTYQGNSGEQKTTVQTRVTSAGMTRLAIDLKKWQESQGKGDAA
jgi:phage antirepressor YoqD-like protein